MFSVSVHHGGGKAKTMDQLRSFDVGSNLQEFTNMNIYNLFQVVITSYNTMLNDRNPRSNKDTKGLLSTNRWHRVILDEAQIIRNRSGQISIAAAKLDSKYRWCLTGTPVTNTL
jgi:SNF2 family DNA or RNA helicase